jgi:16S rRNA G966 N2-methylase RsmD
LQDVFTALPQLVTIQAQFDLVLADPPFGDKNVGRRSTSFSQQLLDHESLPRLLAPSGLFALGHTRRDTLTVPPQWEQVKALKHGDSMVQFLKPKAPGPIPAGTVLSPQ